MALTTPTGRLETTLRGLLEPDGFAAVVTERTAGDGVRIEVRATDAACSDCLVPKDVVVMVLRDQLSTEVGTLDLVYPGDAR